jgi:hypothetical protein
LEKLIDTIIFSIKLLEFEKSLSNFKKQKLKEFSLEITAPQMLFKKAYILLSIK